MAVAHGVVAAPLDARRLRADFPIFERTVNGHPLAFLDSAASAQKPRAVLEAMDALYARSYANVHRGVYTIGVEATAAYERARETVRSLLGAASSREIVFTRNATEALNLVAWSYGRSACGPGDVVVSSELEHHANIVPWQQLAAATGARVEYLRMRDDGTLDLDGLDQIAARGRVRILTVAATSNALGTRNPVRELGDWVHDRGGVLVVDGAQAVPHEPVDVTAFGADFLAFSGHKLGGPTGAGALYGRLDLLREMPPFLTGGEMIRTVTLAGSTWADPPHRFEAGTPAFVEAVGMAAAIDYVTAIGLDRVRAHVDVLTRRCVDALGDLPFVTVHGPRERGGIVAFSVDGVHPHDVCEILDRRAVCVRGGHHCAQPSVDRLGVGATTRASFWLYSVPEEIDQLVAGLHDVRRIFS